MTRASRSKGLRLAYRTLFLLLNIDTLLGRNNYPNLNTLTKTLSG
jgi:hypothetical protein